MTIRAGPQVIRWTRGCASDKVVVHSCDQVANRSTRNPPAAPATPAVRTVTQFFLQKGPGAFFS